jgi:hypothetical protein
MGAAIGQSLPLAVGVALSPVPIIAVVLMLTTPRARANGPAFVLGWLVGLGLVGAIAQTGIPASQQAIAYAVFAIIGTLGVGAPVGIYFAMGKRSAALLGSLKDWMGHNNAVIMSVLCLVIGVKLLGDALTGLTG